MIKRFFDIICAVVGLCLTAPALLLIAVLIKLETPGPVFYRGVRAGRGGSTFRIFKFRSMVDEAEKKGGYSTACNDPRLTKSGRKLRHYKLDELPQLFNILKGEMSFVGPRPQVTYYTNLYNDEEKRILDVRPGLTDFASIEFISLDDILGDAEVDEKYQCEIEPKKNELRLRYVDEQSFMTDMKILFSTIARMFSRNS